MADKMIVGLRTIRQFGVLGIELLHVVFTEIAQAERVSFANRRGGKFLADRHQLNIRTLASGAGRNRRYTRFHLV